MLSCFPFNVISSSYGEDVPAKVRMAAEVAREPINYNYTKNIKLYLKGKMQGVLILCVKIFKSICTILVKIFIRYFVSEKIIR